MREKSKFPKPAKRFFHGAWIILWRFSPAPGEYKQYTVSTGLGREKEDRQDAELILRKFTAALASEEPEFPTEYAATSGVKRYLDDRLGIATKSGNWLDVYEPLIIQEVALSWARPSLSILRRLDAFTDGNIEKTTHDQAQSFLAGMLADDGTPAWRNRVLSMCKRFFGWAVTTKRIRENPFAGIKMLKVPKRSEIVYCTREERDRIIEMAKSMEWPDWTAVPIAFYGGMRKEEIARMEWKDVRFAEGKVIVPITKTGDPREFPMSTHLRELLESVPLAKRHGYVVDVPSGADRLFRLENIYRKIRKLNKGAGRWKDIDKNKPEQERGREPIPDERIGWNAWRHTFGSLLAQAGVSLDKISSWMGNTPEVCRRHYAQFVPRDRHDEDIDKL